MWIGPFEITRGAEIPYDVNAETPQKINVACDGSLGISEAGWSAQFFKLKIIVSESLSNQIYGYIRNNIRFSGSVFIYKDDFGVSRSCRYWGNKIVKRIVASGLWELTLTFRQEVS